MDRMIKFYNFLTISNWCCVIKRKYLVGVEVAKNCGVILVFTADFSHLFINKC